MQKILAPLHNAPSSTALSNGLNYCVSVVNLLLFIYKCVTMCVHACVCVLIIIGFFCMYVNMLKKGINYQFLIDDFLYSLFLLYLQG